MYISNDMSSWGLGESGKSMASKIPSWPNGVWKRMWRLAKGLVVSGAACAPPALGAQYLGGDPYFSVICVMMQDVLGKV